MTKEEEAYPDFSWYPEPEETRPARLWRKVKENPLVPLGLSLTVVALSLGLVNFRRGDHAKQQVMMRARVLAQGGTVVALCCGFAMNSVNKHNKL